jgi:hypothetical protein
MRNDDQFMAKIYIDMTYPKEVNELIDALYAEFDASLEGLNRELVVRGTVEGEAADLEEFRELLDETIDEYYTEAISISIYRYLVDYGKEFEE